MRRLTHARTSDDRGAVAVIVVVLTVVLFGMGALVVDLSSLWAERRQLQNGADGGALAVAQLCAAGDCNGSSGYDAEARTYANANAADGASNVEEVCGSAGTGLPACSVTPSTIPPGAGWVMVRTQTGGDVGPGLVPPVFAKVLAPDYDGRTVKAHAIANWGAPAELTGGLAMTFSACEWIAATTTSDGQTEYAAPPPYPNFTDAGYGADGWPVSDTGQSLEHKIFLHGSTAAGTCDAGPAGSDLPGGFGWLEDGAENDCLATSDAAGWLDDDTGNNVSNACKSMLDADVGTVIFIPVYNETNDLNGTNGAYRIQGFAAFYLTGYYLGSVSEPSLVTGELPCSRDDRCLSGFFTQGLVASDSSGVVGDGPSLGASVVGLAQ